MSDNKETKDTNVVQEGQEVMEVQEAQEVDDHKKEVNEQYGVSTLDVMPTTIGVDRVLADNPSYEGASNQTTNFKLPLYVRGDNFKVLTDHNIAMSIIDETLATVNDKGTGNEQRITQLNRDLSLLRNRLNDLRGIVTNQGNHLNDIDENIATIPTIQADLISQNNLIKALTTRVLALEDGQTSAEGNISTVRSEISTLKNTVNGHRAELERIRNKVKAGYAFKDNVTNGATLTTTVYAGNPIESAKYLITFSGTIKNAVKQTGYFKQVIYDGTTLKGFPSSHISYNKVGTTYNDDFMDIAISVRENPEQSLMTFTANIRTDAGPWGLIMTAIPVY